MKKLMPWKLRPSDFDAPGWHTRPTVGYELMFEFLRLSPSYELARRMRAGELSSEEQSNLPSDFADVLSVFDLLGDVQRTLFRYWWIERGIKAFGSPYTRPRVHELAWLPSGTEATLANVYQSVDQYLASQRPEEGMGPSLILALPVGQRKSEVLRQVAKTLDERAASAAHTAKPRLQLMGKRLRAKVLFNGVRLIWIKAAKPRWELWRLGAMARLSDTYSAVLDVKAPKRVKDENEIHDREMMSKITYRALLKFEAIVENAARGRFPCDSPVHATAFDYPNLAQIIKKRNLWEDREKRRLMSAHKARSTRLQVEIMGNDAAM